MLTYCRSPFRQSILITTLLIPLALIACRFSKWTTHNDANLSIKLDESRKSQANISFAGGSISTTGEDGTKFLLEVPKGALAGDTQISMVPVKSISGLPFGGPSYSVQFAPEGLFFYDSATLTITPRQEIPISEQVFFQFSDDGGTLDPASPVVASREMKIVVDHFSGFGISRTNAEERGNFLRRQSADAERRFNERLARELQIARMKELLGVQDESSSSQDSKSSYEYEDEVLRPLLQAGVASCEGGQETIKKIISWERRRQLLGSPSSTRISNAELQSFSSAVEAKCREEASRKCKAARDPSIYVTYMLGVERMKQLLGAATGPDTNLLAEAKRICLPHSYAATGGSKMQMSGTICDVEKPFQLSAAGKNGATYQYSFRPGGPTFGGVSYTGSQSGCTESGSGQYTVTLSEDGASGTINYSVSGRIVCPYVNSGFSGSESFQLTAAPPCG